MANILWSVFNGLLLLGFWYTFFKAAQLLKRHLGWGTALFFVLGLLLVSGSNSGNKPSVKAQNLLPEVARSSGVGNASAVRKISLETNTLILLAEYYQQDSLIRPHGLFATVSGVVMGHRWEPLSGSLQQRGRQLQYDVLVQHQWLLLGSPIYHSQPQHFAGVIANPAAGLVSRSGP